MLSKAEIITAIREAFKGVTLDGGISLDQTKVIDNYGRGVSPEEFAVMPDREITNDWSAIPTQALDDADCLAHLDQKGLKYYIPALMLRLLDNYDPSEMMSIGTINWLYPKTSIKEYCYSELTENQRRVIAQYLEALPSLVELGYEDKTRVDRAFTRFWSKYLT